MNIQHFTRASLLAFVTAGAAAAQNDECTGAIALLNNSVTAFDNSTATSSVTPWPCVTAGGIGGTDLWYSFTATSGNTVRVSLCGSGFDTLVQAFSGSCASLASIACNDDFCGLQSQINFVGVNGTTYFIRVGGWNSAVGVGTISITEQGPPPPAPVCNGGVTGAPLLGGNGGNIGGAVYFDLSVTSNVSITNLETNYSAAVGTPVGMQIWTAPTTAVGNQANPAAWTLMAMDNGASQSAGINSPTFIVLASPLSLTTGSYGIALVSVGSAHAYTNGNGANQVFTNGPYTLNAGSASNAPFTAPTFNPRVWNGRLCDGAPAGLGVSYCGPAVPNTSFASAVITAAGSATASANNVTLTAASLPLNQFGFFLTSQTQGFVPNPGGISVGNLCLGGTIGRYVGPGQIMNAGPGGSFSLVLNLTQTPAGPVFASITAGQTWNFQAWFRDVLPGGSPTSNFTDGRSILFN